MEADSSLPCSQQPVRNPYTEPNEISPQTSTIFVDVLQGCHAVWARRQIQEFRKKPSPASRLKNLDLPTSPHSHNAEKQHRFLPYSLRSILKIILPSCKYFLSFTFRYQKCLCVCNLSNAYYIPIQSHPSLLEYLMIYFSEAGELRGSLQCNFLQLSFSLLSVN